jgi:hypothetical protein
MNNWKCNCGAVNFSSDANCKRCQSLKPTQQFQPMQEFFEHSAPNGDAASGISKAIGIGSMLCGFGVAALAIFSATEATKPYSLMIALLFIFQGMVLFALFFGFGILIDNVVAIRKNSQHIAGIRANTLSRQQQQNTWQ